VETPVRIFRFFLVVAGTVLCLEFLVEERNMPRTLGVVVLFLFLWLFAGLCRDVWAIRKHIEALDLEIPVPDFSGMSGRAPGVDVLKTLLPGKSRELGGRVFKADETKTCSSCRSFRKEGKMCERDGESLEGITITAVGCQHWSPGLRVTETLAHPEKKAPDSESGPEGTIDPDPEL